MFGAWRETSACLSISQSSIENILIPSFKTLGLDPKDIKHIFITHGHDDHDGGAQYLRDTYNPHVYMTAEDYDLPRGKNVSPSGDQSRRAIRF